MKHLVVGLTGASGSIYGVHLIQFLANAGYHVTVIFTENGLKVANYEMQKKYNRASMSDMKKVFFEGALLENITIEDNKNIFAACASGSHASDALIVLPCSMGTLAAMANGLSANLLQRVGDVTLKERKHLILCTREAPYSLVHLRNMAAVTEAGGVILPCSPGFYMFPQTIEDLVNFVVGKVLDVLQIPHQISPRWQASSEMSALNLQRENPYE